MSLGTSCGVPGFKSALLRARAASLPFWCGFRFTSGAPPVYSRVPFAGSRLPDQHRTPPLARRAASEEGLVTTTYAVIKTGGKQYRVAQGDKLHVEKLAGNVGDAVTFGEVLLVGERW